MAHEKMRPGESVEIRTRNGIAGIRGTVVIAEVSELPRAAAGPAEVATTFTVLRGIVDVRLLDPTSRPQGGAAVITLTALQSVGIRPRVAAQRVRLTRDAARRTADAFKMSPGDVPVGAGVGVTDADFREAARQAAAVSGDDRNKRDVHGNGEKRALPPNVADRGDTTDNIGDSDLTRVPKLFDGPAAFQKPRLDDARRSPDIVSDTKGGNGKGKK